MNLTCPNCNGKTISFWKGFLASGASPAKCSECGGLSAPGRLALALENIIQQAVAIIMVVLSLYAKSWLLLALILPALLFIHAVTVSLNRLHTVTEAGKSFYKIASYTLIVALVLSLYFFKY